MKNHPFVILLLSFTTFFHSPFTTRAMTPFPTGLCYTGAFLGWGEYEDNVTLRGLREFETLSGRRAALVPFSVFFGRGGENFSSNLKVIEEYGAVPIVRLMPWGPPYWVPGYESEYDLRLIVQGEFDDFISGIAKEIRAFPWGVIVTFGPEMNGDWFPWSGVYQGGGKRDGFGDPDAYDGPELFRAAYRHVVDLFRQEGCKNVYWLFQVNYDSVPEVQWNSPLLYYPGDSYVDVLGLSIYGEQYQDEPWVSFDVIAQEALEGVKVLLDKKPLILPEWGVGEWPPHDKAKWYREALERLSDPGGPFRAAVIYSDAWENDDGTISDLRIDSSKEALEAYRSGIEAPYFNDLACPLMKGALYPRTFGDNVTDGTLRLAQGEGVELALSLDITQEMKGANLADWWVFARTPFGTYSLTLTPALMWHEGLEVTYQGPLVPIEKVAFQTISGLPMGTYDVYFAVDLNANGILDGPLFCSSVRLVVE